MNEEFNVYYVSPECLYQWEGEDYRVVKTVEDDVLQIIVRESVAN